tara:strand:+ start:4963 stop:14616 length:9654 start_codon:yes stop_codon:yes gene_type:complete
MSEKENLGEGVSNDFTFEESFDGFSSLQTNPFYPNFDFATDDDGTITGHQVVFNQAYVYNRISSDQFTSKDGRKISNMDAVYKFPPEHDKDFYVRVVVDKENFLIQSAEFTGYDADVVTNLETNFPHILFSDDDDTDQSTEFTGHYPVISIKNGSISRYTQRGDLVFDKRQFKQLGESGLANTESDPPANGAAFVLVKSGYKDDTLPVRVRAVSGAGEVFVFQRAETIIVSGSGSAGVGGSCVNIGGGAKVYEDGSSSPFEFRTLTGADPTSASSSKNNTTVEIDPNNADQIFISGGHSLSVGTGQAVYKNDTIRPFEFKSLAVTGPNISISSDTGTITINHTEPTHATPTWQEVTDEGATTTNSIAYPSASVGGGYASTTPPSNGMFIEGQVGVGLSSFGGLSENLVVCGTQRIKDSTNNADGALFFGNQGSDGKLSYDHSEGTFNFGAGINSFTSTNATEDSLLVFPDKSVIVGGVGMTSSDMSTNSPATGAAVLAGSGNKISGNFNVIVGGSENAISGKTMNFIGGGSGIDILESEYSVNVGGRNNDISGADFSVIGGGFNNLIQGSNSVIVGGQENKIKDRADGNDGFNFLGAGGSNTIDGINNVLAGGINNLASGQRNAIIGGQGNETIANDAVVAGNFSKVQKGHDGAFVFSDSITTPALSVGANTMLLDFKSGVYVTTDSGLYINGNAVLTGETPEGDTLQSVTARGNTTTTDIKAAHISGTKLTLSDDNIIDSNGEILDFQANDLIANGKHIRADFGIWARSAGGRNMGIDGNTNFMQLYTNSTEKVRITQVGDVGIGTTDPDYRLDIGGNTASTSNTIRMVQGDGGTAIRVGAGGLSNDVTLLRVDGGGNGSSGISDSGAFGFSLKYMGSRSANQNGLSIFSDNQALSQVEAVTILQDGNVGIGVSDPDAKLEVFKAGGSLLKIGTDATNFGSSIGYNVNPSSNTVFTLGHAGSALNRMFHIDGTTSLRAGGHVLLEIEADTNQTEDMFRATSSGGTAGDIFIIKPSGEVGIGTTDPDTSLHLATSTAGGDPSFIIQDSGRGGSSTLNYIALKDSGNAFQAKIGYLSSLNTQFNLENLVGDTVLKSSSQTRIIAGSSTLFDNGGSEVARITSAGRFGIGTNNPASLLHVSSASSESELRIESDNGNGDPFLHFKLDGGTSFSMGIDDDDSNNFVISRAATLGTNNVLEFDATKTNVYGNLLVGEADGTLDGSRLEVWTTNSQSPFSITNTTNSNRKVLDSEFNSNHPRFSIFNASATEAIRLETNGDSFFSGGNVGIGTTAPAKKFHVEGESQLIGDTHVSGDLSINHTSFTTYQTGKIFVNNSNQFQINYGTREALRATLNTSTTIFGGTTQTTFVKADNADLELKAQLGGQLKINSYFGDDDLAFSSHGGNKILSVHTDASANSFVVGSNSNVGIGLNNPAHKLVVSGDVGGTGDGGRITLNGTGYLLSGEAGTEADTLQTVTNRGNSTTNNISISGGSIFGDTVTPNIKLGNAGGAEFNYGTSKLINGGSLVWQGGGAEKFRITAAGNVGIGTNAPSQSLHVEGDVLIKEASPRLIIQDSTDDDDHSLQFKDSSFSTVASITTAGDNLNLATVNNRNITLKPSGVEALRATVDGKVGIGTSSPDFALEVVADDSAGVMAVRNSGNARDTFRSENAAGTRTFNIGNDANGHGLVLVRGAGGTTTSQIAGNGDTFFDTDTLYIDHSTNRVGIGTNSPSFNLDIYENSSDTDALLKLRQDGDGDASMGFNIIGSTQLSIGLDNSDGDKFKISRSSSLGSSTQLTIDSAGDVGIGTTSPSKKLDVRGDTLLSGAATIRKNGTSNTNFLTLDSPATVGANVNFIFEIGDDALGLSSKNLLLRGSSGSSDIAFSPSTSAEGLLVLDGGANRVGIGTTNPSEKLTVKGGDFSVDTDTFFVDTTNDRVGIGRVNPSHALNVIGDIKIDNANGSNAVDAGSLIFSESGDTFGTDMFGFRINQNGSTNRLKFQSANTSTIRDILTLTRDTARVGIGTTNPSHQLSVAGDVFLDGDNQQIFFGGTNTFVGESSNSQKLQLRGGGSNSSHTISIDSQGRMGFGAVATERITITDGNIELVNSNTGVDLGTLNNADAKQSVALGYDNDALGLQSSAVGYLNNATGNQSTAHGNSNSAAVEGTAIGCGNHATASRGTAVGRANSAAQESTAIGFNSQVAGIRSIGIGRNVTASAQASIAIGDTAKATGSNSIALGLSAEAGAFRSTAVGYDTTVDAVALDSVAFGFTSRAAKTQAGAFGYQVLASGERSFGFGYYTTVGAGRVTELGQYSSTRQRNAAVRINGSSSTRVPVAMTMHSGTNAPLASSAADGYEDGFSLASDMYSIQKNGADYILYHNLGGSIQSTTLGASEADTLQTVTDRGATTTNTIRIESTDFASLVLDRGASNSSIVQFENDNGIVGGIGGFNDDGLIFRSKDGNQMALNASNNFGVGTINPIQKLHVKGIGCIEDTSSTAFGTLQFGTDTSRYIRGNSAELQAGPTIQQLHFQKTNAAAQIASSAADGVTAIQLLARNVHTSANILEVVNGNGQTADFVIDSDGHVGIGISTPSTTLDVRGHEIAVYPTGVVGSIHIGESFGHIGLFGTSNGGDSNPPEKIVLSAANRNTNNSSFIEMHSRFGTSTGSFGNIDLHGGFFPSLGMEGDINLITSGINRLTVNCAGNVGIGNDSTAAKVDIRTDSSTTNGVALRLESSSGAYFRAFHGGKVLMDGPVGIGTASPATKLDVADKIRVAENSNVAFYGADFVRLFVDQTYKFKDSGGTTNAQIGITGDSFFNGGNVGIGTNSPTHKLDVRGDIVVKGGSTQHSVIRFRRSNSVTDFGYIGFENPAAANDEFLISSAGNGNPIKIQAGANDTIHFYGNTTAYGGFDGNGNFGIGTTSPASDLHILGANDVGGGITLSTSASNSTNKVGRIKVTHYNTSEEPVTMLLSNTQSAANIVTMGGGSSVENAATQLRFKTAANNTTTNGTERMRINSAGNVGIGTINPVSITSTVSSLTLNGTHSSVGGGIVYQVNGTTKAFHYVESNLLRHQAQAGVGHQFFANAVERMRIQSDGNVGIGTSSPSSALEVVGHFSATSKSFLIDHPTKENKKLQYASLEGPENGVYVRGTSDTDIINLPEYWSELVHENTITVTLTAIGKKQDLFIIKKSPQSIEVGGVEGSYDYVIYGERKDVDKLEIEPLKV